MVSRRGIANIKKRNLKNNVMTELEILKSYIYKFVSLRDYEFDL